MKKELFGWYPKSDEEKSDIWKTAMFVPDTNVLLHCIRLPAENRENLLRLFENIGDSLWIPYQVGLEFHRNRMAVEGKIRNAYEDLRKNYKTGFNQIKSSLDQFRAHPTIKIDEEFDALNESMNKFNVRLDAAKVNHPKTSELEMVFNKIIELFEGRTGEKLSNKNLDEIREEGAARYAQCVPPGYKDADKEEGKKYGDLIIWKSMIEKAKLEKKPVVFITKEDKEDWWWKHNGKIIGPRPELVEEFKRAAKQEFLIYKADHFMKVAASHYPQFKNDLNAVEKSLQQDSKAIFRQNIRGKTPMHNAALNDAVARMEWLKAEGVDINAADNIGNTPMHNAAKSNAIAAMEWLKAEGVDINARNVGGFTPMHYAELNDARAAIEWLRENGGKE